MSLKHLLMTDVRDADFVPQAVISRSPESLARHLNVDFTRGHDEFDEYLGAAFALHGTLPFSIKHYLGHPDGTVTLYLPPDISDVGKITQLIADILGEMRLDESALEWQRADNPDL
jgi:hypothetical protein